MCRVRGRQGGRSWDWRRRAARAAGRAAWEPGRRTSQVLEVASHPARGRRRRRRQLRRRVSSCYAGPSARTRRRGACAPLRAPRARAPRPSGAGGPGRRSRGGAHARTAALRQTVPRSAPAGSLTTRRAARAPPFVRARAAASQGPPRRPGAAAARTRSRRSARACASAATALGTWSPSSRPTPPTRGTPAGSASRCSAPRRRQAAPSSARPTPQAACSMQGWRDCSRARRAGAAAAPPWQAQGTRELGRGAARLGRGARVLQSSYDANLAFCSSSAQIQQHSRATRGPARLREALAGAAACSARAPGAPSRQSAA